MFSTQEEARYFTAPAGAVECLSATFHRYCYAPHAHETFVVGALSHGSGEIFIRGRQHIAHAGDLTLYNPHDVHDGTPGDRGFSYRVSYPSSALVCEIASESTNFDRGGTPNFAEPIVHDPDGAALFFEAHLAWESGCTALQADEMLLRAYAYCLSRYGGVRFTLAGREAGPIARVIALLSERYADRLTLDELAAEAGLPRQRLIRAFRRDTGLTPHAFLVNRRVDVAKTLLRRGIDPLAAAMATGFTDQAHLTRTFKARVGVTPGVFRAAFARTRH